MTLMLNNASAALDVSLETNFRFNMLAANRNWFYLRQSKPVAFLAFPVGMKGKTKTGKTIFVSA